MTAPQRAPGAPPSEASNSGNASTPWERLRPAREHGRRVAAVTWTHARRWAVAAWRHGLRVITLWTAMLAIALPRVGGAALRATGRWTELLSRALPRTFDYASRRLVPSAAGLLVLGAATVTWVVIVTASLGPAAARYMGAVDVELDLPEEAALAQLGERSVVYAADESQLAVLHDEVDRRVVTLDSLPHHVWQAIITAEDRRFFEHGGWDVEAISRAAVANLRARDIEQGGSTITQQLAKQNFVGDDVTFERKAVELTYAMALEQEYSKRELLQRYMNEVYFGAGAYGIAAAAEEFFSVAPEELRVDQAALLASLVRAPSLLDPRNNAEGAQIRRDAVLRGMVTEGYLLEQDADVALSAPIEVREPQEREVIEPYVVEAVKRDIFSNPAFGETREERIDALFRGGLRIYTTVDPRLQQIADEVIADRLPSGAPTAAIAAVDPRDGRVLAVASGMDFEQEQFDLATQGRRQPGSAFKTFALAAALERGIPLEAVFDGSSPVSIDFDPDHQEPWEPANYGGASYGPLNLREAHIRSINTIFAQLVVTIGTERVQDMAARLGIDVEAAFGPESARGPAAMSLGGLHRGVTPLEMASAFGTFATGGVRAQPHVVARVTDPEGNELYRHEAATERVVDEAVAGTMIDVMQDTVRRGTATGAQLPGGWAPAGKTGTTQTSADGWFVGTVPVLSTAVWVGHPAERISVRGLTGGSIPATIWRDFMSRALDGVDPVAFDTRPARVTSGEVRVPNVEGRGLADALQRLAGAQLVGAVSGGDHSGARVVSQQPSAGSTVSAGTQVRLSTSGRTSDVVQARDGASG